MGASIRPGFPIAAVADYAEFKAIETSQNRGDDEFTRHSPELGIVAEHVRRHRLFDFRPGSRVSDHQKDSLRGYRLVRIKQRAAKK
jgi:hypothetical protein